MKLNRIKFTVLIGVLLFGFGLLLAKEKKSSPSTTPSGLDLYPGYKIEIYQDDVPGARSLTLSPGGTIFVGTRQNKVFAIRDHKTYTIAKGLNSPNGVAFRDGDLYVGEINRILKFENIENYLENPPKPLVIYDKLPTESHHGWKFIKFGPDGKLYVPVGAPCNICDKEPPYSSLLRFSKLDGGEPEVFARGIRNTVGFDWRPGSNVLWFTDNGRDWLGDDLPSDELNRAPKPGMHFGYPYCHQGDTLDPDFGEGKSCKNYTPPVLKLGPHVAALGMRFLDKNTILIAQHGSWNRSVPIGYRVMKVTLKGNQVLKYEAFLDGFLNKKTGEPSGRPVDVEILPDHSILISDDVAGRIYRMYR